MTTSLLAGDLELLQNTATGVEPFISIVIGSTTIQGTVETTGKDVLGNQGIGGFSGRQVIVIVRTADMPKPPPANGTLITVDAQVMRIRDYYPVDRGELTHIFCEADA